MFLVVPVWEHDFKVFKVPEDEHNDNDDVELSRLFRKSNGEWIIVQYRGFTCNFCDLQSCDRAQYGDDLDDLWEKCHRWTYQQIGHVI